ncbi:uncharacterized protein LOC123870965 [Maniola jurtina]|uniref:uncharacterized protein LOC123870965 n=1 Tax=Maniola jurtina TaxID=191418 RepID=UPI001E68943D|nr:uncharacterized protein LOC123870965 [Maniola jurtina]
MITVAKMKLFILALFSLILAVSSESENSKTSTVKDQKNDNSAFLQKFLPPLKHNVHQRYGMNHGLNSEEVIKNMLRNDHRYYDYVDDHDDHYLRYNGRSRQLHNEPNIWGYSRNGGLGSLVSHSYNGDPNVWGYLRNSEGRMRNMGGHSRHQNDGHIEHEDRLGNMGRVYMRPGNKAHISMMGPENMEYENMRNENMPHININALLEPDHVGYVGQVHPNRMGIKERYDFAMVTGRDLDAHRRRPMYHAHGLATPMPSLLGMGGIKHNTAHMPMHHHGV